MISNTLFDHLIRLISKDPESFWFQLHAFYILGNLCNPVTFIPLLIRIWENPCLFTGQKRGGRKRTTVVELRYSAAELAAHVAKYLTKLNVGSRQREKEVWGEMEREQKKREKRETDKTYG